MKPQVKPVGWLPCGGYSGNRPATTMRPPAHIPTAVVEPRESTMAQVEKRIAYTSNVNTQGELILNGEIPNAWSDFIGAHATLQDKKGWVANVDRTGQDQLTVTCLRRNGTQLESIPQGTQVTVLLTLVGQA